MAVAVQFGAKFGAAFGKVMFAPDAAAAVAATEELNTALQWVEGELGRSEGPLFLGKDLSLVSGVCVLKKGHRHPVHAQPVHHGMTQQHAPHEHWQPRTTPAHDHVCLCACAAGVMVVLPQVDAAVAPFLLRLRLLEGLSGYKLPAGERQPENKGGGRVNDCCCWDSMPAELPLQPRCFCCSRELRR